MTVLSRTTPLLITLLAAFAAGWVYLVQCDGGDRAAGTEDVGRIPGHRTGDAPSLTVEGAQAKSVVKDTPEDSLEPAAARPWTVAEVVARASTSESKGWAGFRFGQDGAIDPEIGRIISNELLGGWMDAPPFQVAVVLGASDLPWLKDVAASLAHGLAELQRADPDHSKERGFELRKDALEELALLAEKRFANSPDLQNKFDDRRTLASLDAGSQDRAWLEAMVAATEHTMLWTYPDLMPRTWRKSLTARDLPLLSRLKRRVFDLQRGVGRGTMQGEWREQVRPLAQELRNHLESRAPEAPDDK